jgi:dTDP-4-amino-4,6-dideoxygalactose transaminase
MQMLGLNYFLTDFQCALGISQLKKLDSFVRRRRRIAKLYGEYLKNVEEIILPIEKKGFTHSYHIYVVRVRPGKLAGGRDALYEELQARGIRAHLHYEPVYRHPYYRKRYAVRRKDFPRCEEYFRTALTLPLFPAMTDADVRRVASEVTSAARRLRR